MKKIIFALFRSFYKIQNRLFEKFNNPLQNKLSKDTGFYHLLSFLNKLRCKCLEKTYNKFKPKGVVLKNIQGNKMYINTDDKKGIALILLMNPIMEKYTTELFKKMVRKNMIVIDIGANIGYFTLIAAKLVGKDGIVYSFEPKPNNYQLLCRNINTNNYINIVPVQKAISNKESTTKLWFNEVNSLSPSFSKKNVLSFLEDRDPKKIGFIKVKTITLDRFFGNIVNDKIDLMKIDAEGAEGLILDGAKRILRFNEKLKIFMEFWPGGLRNFGTDPIELLNKLQRYGFTINFINEEKKILEPVKEFRKFCSNKRLKDGFNLLLEK